MRPSAVSCSVGGMWLTRGFVIATVLTPEQLLKIVGGAEQKTSFIRLYGSHLSQLRSSQAHRHHCTRILFPIVLAVCCAQEVSNNLCGGRHTNKRVSSGGLKGQNASRCNTSDA